MAEQLDANESTPLLSPDLLYPYMGQEGEERDHGIYPISPSSNIIIQPNPDIFTLSSSTSSGSSIMMQVDHQGESLPPLLAVSQDSNIEQQQHEGRYPSPHSNSPRVEHETQRSSSDLMHIDTEQQHELLPRLHSSLGELSPSIQHSVEDHSTSNIVTQQVEREQQHQPFSLSGPMQSSIMLRRNAHAESASAARSSASQGRIENVTPQRVKQIISTLGFDEDLSETLFKLIITTAPFHKANSQPAPSAPGESNPQADALRQTLGGLMFSPQSPIATTTENGSLAGNTNENPTGDLLFDANAAGTLGSHPIEERSDSPPLLWSTAAVEEPLDSDTEDPTYYTIAEFVNTIIENRIQVESVTEEDWLIEEVRVGILNHLMKNPSEEDPIAEGGLDDVGGTEEQATEQTKIEENASKPDLTVEGNSGKEVVTEEKAPEQAQAKEDTSISDLQRWIRQGPSGWLKRDDGTDMNEEEIDEECARWDAMVRKARAKKEAEKAAALLGKNVDVKDQGFWEYVRSSKQKEQTKSSISTHGQNETASISTHDPDEKASQQKSKKGSRKNKNKNRNAKKNALKAGDAEIESEGVCHTDTFPSFLDLPTRVRKKVLGFILVVDQELVPYHYVKSKIVKDSGLREKPNLNILLALCSSTDKNVKKCLDDAKNILYRCNIFSIQKPNELIMFLGTIGGDNMARLKMGKNLLVTEGFFHKKRQYEFEFKWLARWGRDLLFVMQGRNIVRSDIVAEDPEDDLTCEPTDIEKALQSMVGAIKDEEKMSEMLKETGNSDGSSPVRLRSLDLGEQFGSLAAQIETMGLATGDSKVTTSDTAKIPETRPPEKAMESMSQKHKRKALEAGKMAANKGEDIYGESFIKAVTGPDEDDEEILSQNSGVYTASAYSEPGKKPISNAHYSIDTIR